MLLRDVCSVAPVSGPTDITSEVYRGQARGALRQESGQARVLRQRQAAVLDVQVLRRQRSRYTGFFFYYNS